MTTNQIHITIAIIVTFACSFTVYTAFSGKPEIQQANASSSPLSHDTGGFSGSASSLIYHTKMVVLESLVLTKKSVNTIIDTAIEIL